MADAHGFFFGCFFSVIEKDANQSPFDEAAFNMGVFWVGINLDFFIRVGIGAGRVFFHKINNRLQSLVGSVVSCVGCISQFHYVAVAAVVGDAGLAD